MVAEKIITTAILPLRTSDTGDQALAIMDDFHVRHLPIVNDKQLLGVISDDDILLHDVGEAVGSYALSLRRPYVKDTDHIYEVMRLLAEHQLTVIPVVNADNDYEGMISQEDVLNFFARTASFSDTGSIVVLEIGRRDYSMTEISRIVESEGAVILSSFITSEQDANLIEVTIKINRQNIQNIISTFERFNYSIKASFNEQEYLESLQERYDSLMSYLSI
ncbi:MAG: CBS domain-containing protein [Bacteroidetes bacterium]|jgi:CBS domain-containing protein|nr:CBS domain-containing protein [Bacteroidota bacterium]